MEINTTTQEKTQKQQDPSKLLLIASPENINLVQTVLSTVYPVETSQGQQVNDKDEGKQSKESNKSGVSIKVSNKYFESIIQIDSRDISNWITVPSDQEPGDLMDYEAIIIVADEIDPSQMNSVFSLVKAANALQPEIKMCLISTVLEDAEEYDLEKFYERADGGFIEVAVQSKLAEFGWNSDSQKDYNDLEKDNEGFLRLIEAIDNGMWNNRESRKEQPKFPDISVEKEKELIRIAEENQKDGKPQKELPEREGQGENLEKEMDDLGALFSQMMAFKQKRDTLTDDERKEQASRLVMKLAASMGDDDDSDNMELGNLLMGTMGGMGNFNKI